MENQVEKSEEKVKLVFDRRDGLAVLYARYKGEETVSNPKCKKCFGRGFLGWDANGGMPVPCKCLANNFKQKFGNVSNKVEFEVIK